MSLCNARRRQYAYFSADLMTTDNELHVTQTPQAVLDPITDQWCVELLCGTFTYLGLPPFDVQWTVSDVL